VLRSEQDLRVTPDILTAEWVVAPNSPSFVSSEHLSSIFDDPSPHTDIPTYPTRWRASVTLEELLNDPQVRKVAFAKARSLGYTHQDSEDCFQLGSINLWKALQACPTLLADKGAAWVGIRIAFSGSRRALWKHEARSIAMDEAIGEVGFVSQKHRPEPWATWATRVDERIDFTLLMNTLTQMYDHDPLKLFALYSLTTSVKMKDVQVAAKAHKNELIQARSDVKRDLRELLQRDEERDVEEEFWKTKDYEVAHLECVKRVSERIIGNQRLLLALYIVTTSVKRKDVAELFNIPLTKFRQEIAQVKTMLSEEHRKLLRSSNCSQRNFQ
jgi:hypothetical protein